MPDWNAIQAFIAAVVPWPVEIEPGYINLHFSMPPKPGEIKKKYGSVPGWPWRDVQELINRSRWMGTQPNFKDQWFCLSRQKDTGPPNNKGKARALRNLVNSTHMKALWVDIDFGKKDKLTGAPVGYKSYDEGLQAILQFSNAVGLPTPSAVVKSGGGLHVYWISKEVLLKADWLAYAQGLKNLLLQHNVQCDAGLTTDASRVLRMPGSKNFKYAPPVEVVFDTGFPLAMYDFDPAFMFLQNAAGPMQQAAPAETPHNIFADGVTADAFKAGTAAGFQSLDKSESLSAGIEKRTEFLVSPAEVFKKCGFYRDALRTSGAHHSQPLWNLAVLGTTFMQRGEKFAHAISSKHPDYNEADTQALYDRKVAERSAQGIGYPRCASFESNGSKHCASCPLRANGKSPLNIRAPIVATVTGTSSPSVSSGQASWKSQPSFSFSNIPHRKWLYGFDLVRGELTVIGSPGGAGKSSLAIGMAICAATGRELLEEKVRGTNLKALVINGEDSTEELRRRVYAFCLAHGIAERDLKRLTVVGADDSWVQKISLLKINEKGWSALNQEGLDALQLALDELHPDVIVLDPLVSFCAGGNMNDNAVMSSVMRKLKEIAAREKCAMLIVHHTRKGGDAGNVETISGAAAITNLARRAIMPVPLTDADTTRLAILPSERFQYLHLVDAKSNLAPRATDRALYRLTGVELPNPEPPLYPNGDNVQAITRVVLPIQPNGAANADDMKIELAIYAVAARGKMIDGQVYPYSPSLAGASNERALLQDAMAAVADVTAPRQWLPGDLKAVTNTAIKKMKADGRFVVRDIKDLMPNSSRFRRGRGLEAVPI